MQQATQAQSRRYPDAPEGLRKASPSEGPGILERVRAGEDGAFEQLVRGQGPALLAAARRLLCDEAEAWEAVQVTFDVECRPGGPNPADADLPAWLRKTLVATALSRLQSSRRQPESGIEDLLPRFDAQGHHRVPVSRWLAGDELESILSDERTRAAVRGSLERLPLVHRVILILRDIEGLSAAEVAGLLSLPESATEIRLHRARLALRTLLEPIFLAPPRPAASGSRRSE